VRRCVIVRRAARISAWLNVSASRRIGFEDKYAYTDGSGSSGLYFAGPGNPVPEDGVPVLGMYNGRINLFRAAAEPSYSSYAGDLVISDNLALKGEMMTVTVTARPTYSALETAILTIGHEAAHGDGVDMNLPGFAPHPNAERAGRIAVELYRANRADMDRIYRGYEAADLEYCAKRYWGK
jgi:hypothetical protein